MWSPIGRGLRAAPACDFGGLLSIVIERFLDATRWRRWRSAAPPLCFAPDAKGLSERDEDDFFLLDRAPLLGLNAGLRVTLELLRDVSRRLDFFLTIRWPCSNKTWKHPN